MLISNCYTKLCLYVHIITIQVLLSNGRLLWTHSGYRQAHYGTVNVRDMSCHERKHESSPSPRQKAVTNSVMYIVHSSLIVIRITRSCLCFPRSFIYGISFCKQQFPSLASNNSQKATMPSSKYTGGKINLPGRKITDLYSNTQEEKTNTELGT